MTVVTVTTAHHTPVPNALALVCVECRLASSSRALRISWVDPGRDSASPVICGTRMFRLAGVRQRAHATSGDGHPHPLLGRLLRSRLEDEHADLAAGAAAVALVPGPDAERLGPVPAALGARRPAGGHLRRIVAGEREGGSSGGLEVARPGRMVPPPPVRRDDDHSVAVANMEKRDGSRLSVRAPDDREVAEREVRPEGRGRMPPKAEVESWEQPRGNCRERPRSPESPNEGRVRPHAGSSSSSSSSSRIGMPKSPIRPISGFSAERAASTAPGRSATRRKPRRW